MRGEPPAAQNSGNKTLLEEYIGIAFVVTNSLILLITFAVGIAANVFVILAVYRKKSLQTSNNALVVNLAVIDILRCVVDCPILLTIIITVYQRGHANLLLCDAQVVSFSFSCCIQLLTLACISAQRYQAIAKPFKTSQRRRQIMVSVPLTWILAIPAAVLCLTYVKDSPVYVKCQGSQRKTSSYDTFGLYMLLPLWAACFSVIIGFYTSIFILIKAHNRKIFDKGTFPLPKENKTEDKPIKEEATVKNGIKKPEESQTMDANITQMEAVTHVEPNSFKKDSAFTFLTPAAPQSTSIASENQKTSNNSLEVIELDREQPHPPAMLDAVQAGMKTSQTQKSNLCAVTAEVKPSNGITADSVKSSTSKLQTMPNNCDSEKKPQEKVKIDKLSFEMNQTDLCVASTPQSHNPESTSVLLIKPEPGKKNSDTGGAQTTGTGDKASSLSIVTNNAPKTEAKQQHVEGAVCMMPSIASNDRANKKKESKMAKRAGYIIFTFLLFWLPLITTITINFVLNKNKNTQIQIIQELEILSVCVSCITSLSDPIIYAAVNPQFREEFYHLRNKFKSVFNAK